MLSVLLTSLLAILSSSGFGAVLGLASGLLKQVLDTRAKKLDLEHEERRWASQLNSKRVDLEIAQAEASGRREIAIVEGAARVEESAYNALSAAYASDKISDAAWEAAKNSTVGRFLLLAIETLQRSVRPLLTYVLTGSAIYLNIWVVDYADKMWLQMTIDQRYQIVTQIISWVLFQASAVLSYWFVNRPAALPPK